MKEKKPTVKKKSSDLSDKISKLEMIYDDLIKVYKPKRLRIVLDCNPRGGISSRLTQDSDWKSLGGKEEYINYTEDVW